MAARAGGGGGGGSGGDKGGGGSSRGKRGDSSASAGSGSAVASSSSDKAKPDRDRWENPLEPRRWNPTPLLARDIRLVAFHEDIRKGERFQLYDTDLVPDSSPDGKNTTAATKAGRKSQDEVLLGEMMFGTLPLSHSGVSSKLHELRAPKRVLVTQVFPMPGEGSDSAPIPVRHTGSQTTMERTSRRPSSQSQSSRNNEGGLDHEEGVAHTYTESIGDVLRHVPRGASSSASELSSSVPSSQLSTAEMSYRHKRIARSQQTSVEYGIRRTDVTAHHYDVTATPTSHGDAPPTAPPLAATPTTKRCNSCAIGVIIAVHENLTLESFVMSHYALLELFLREFMQAWSHIIAQESESLRLQAATPNATARRGVPPRMLAGALRQSAAVCAAVTRLQRKIAALYMCPRIQEPVWLNMTSYSQLRNSIQHTFADTFRSAFTTLGGGASVTSDILSLSITAVLLLHPGWTSTVAPTGETAGEQLSKVTPPGAVALFKMHPYDPLWAQLCDLTGAIVSPARVSRTIVVGREAESVWRVLSVLSYFLRCSEVFELQVAPKRHALHFSTEDGDLLLAHPSPAQTSPNAWPGAPHVLSQVGHTPDTSLRDPHTCPYTFALRQGDVSGFHDLAVGLQGKMQASVPPLIRDRTYYLRVFRACFRGDHFVQWLLTTGQARTVDEACVVGCSLLMLGHIHHVVNAHNFKNEPLFYRFADDDSPCYVLEYRELSWLCVHTYSIFRTSGYIRDYRVHGTHFKNSFPARQLVEWFLQQGLAKSREEAVHMGRRLQHFKLLLPVDGKYTFRDNHAPFRFHFDELKTDSNFSRVFGQLGDLVTLGRFESRRRMQSFHGESVLDAPAAPEGSVTARQGESPHVAVPEGPVLSRQHSSSSSSKVSRGSQPSLQGAAASATQSSSQREERSKSTGSASKSSASLPAKPHLNSKLNLPSSNQLLNPTSSPLTHVHHHQQGAVATGSSPGSYHTADDSFYSIAGSYTASLHGPDTTGAGTTAPMPSVPTTPQKPADSASEVVEEVTPTKALEPKAVFSSSPRTGRRLESPETTPCVEGNLDESWPGDLLLASVSEAASLDDTFSSLDTSMRGPVADSSAAPSTAQSPSRGLDEAQGDLYTDFEEVPLRTTMCTRILPDMSLSAVEARKNKERTVTNWENEMYHKTFGRSLLCSYSPEYVSGPVLQGVPATTFFEELDNDLKMAVSHSVIHQEVHSAACAILDLNSMTCEIRMANRLGEIRHFQMMASPMVQRATVAFHNLLELGMSVEFCFDHLEDRLQDIYHYSKLVASYVTEKCMLVADVSSINEHQQHQQQAPTLVIEAREVADALGVDLFDIPLLVAVASTHTPIVGQVVRITDFDGNPTWSDS